MSFKKQYVHFLLPLMFFLAVFAIFLISKRIYYKKYIYPLHKARSFLKSNKNTISLVALTNVEFQEFLVPKMLEKKINSINDISETYKILENTKFDSGIFLGTNDDFGKRVLGLFSMYFLNYKIIINDYYKLIMFENYSPLEPLSINYIEEFNLKTDSIGFEINEQNEFSFNFEFFPTKGQFYIIELETIEQYASTNSNMQLVVVYKTERNTEHREAVFISNNYSEHHFLLKSDPSINSIHLFIWNPEKAKIKIKKPKIKTYVSRETIKNLSSDINH